MARKERRTTYEGPAELWVDGEKRFDVVAQLNGWVEVIEVTTTGDTLIQDGVTSWGGIVLDGPGQAEVLSLMGRHLEFHFPNGKVGIAVFGDAAGTLQGIRETPF